MSIHFIDTVKAENTQAVLLYYTRGSAEPGDQSEFQSLVEAAGLTPMATLVVKRPMPTPNYLIGEGKLTELLGLVEVHGAQLVIVSHALTPAQNRNLEQALGCRVLDKTTLILDIFAQRAETFEGKLQVELAQLTHLKTKLIRGWTHLERQKGGIGLRGPGETQLETDRRLIDVRIDHIQKKIGKLKQQRHQSRRARARAELPTVALVGYTNAGKSSVFNYLTQANRYADEQLFATLDPSFRQLIIPKVGPVVLSDTVGFIRDLPHSLVAAFSATLEAAAQADLLLHVVDFPALSIADTIAPVQAVLQEIEADQVPTLLVYNKIDLCEESPPRIDYDEEGVPSAVYLSTHTGQGMDLLLQAMRRRLVTEWMSTTLILSPLQGKARATLYALGVVASETVDEEGDSHLQVEMSVRDYQRIFH